MGNFDQRDREPEQPVIIEDLRHRRDAAEEEEEAAATPEPAAAPEPAPTQAAAAPQPAAVQQPPVEPPARPVAADASEAGAPGEFTEEELTAAQEAEYAYLMQIFGMGLPGYLRSQLGILLNFALINLGRAPNPATSLVGVDLDQAKLAIDGLEFILTRLQASLEARERTEMLQMLSELKYTFMQMLGAAPTAMVPPAGGEA